MRIIKVKSRQFQDTFWPSKHAGRYKHIKEYGCLSDNTISRNEEVTDAFGELHSDNNNSTCEVKLLSIIIFSLLIIGRAPVSIPFVN
jgi:hypothetical protein